MIRTAVPVLVASIIVTQLAALGRCQPGPVPLVPAVAPPPVACLQSTCTEIGTEATTALNLGTANTLKADNNTVMIVALKEQVALLQEAVKKLTPPGPLPPPGPPPPPGPAPAPPEPSGHGSGMDMPVGAVVMWAGDSEAVPKGWKLCDGFNGTPDLRDKFVVGVGTKHPAGASNKGETETALSQHATSTEYNKLIPNHTNPSFSLKADTLVVPEKLNCTGATGHKPGCVTITTTLTSVYAPPYYALAYLMRTNSACCECECAAGEYVNATVTPLLGQTDTAACTAACGDTQAPKPCGKAFGRFIQFC